VAEVEQRERAVEGLRQVWEDLVQVGELLGRKAMVGGIGAVSEAQVRSLLTI